MIKRVLTGLVTAVVATVAFGTVSAQPADAIQDPSRKCVWIWTSTGGHCSKLE